MKMIVEKLPSICGSITENFPTICSCITTCVSSDDNRSKLRCQLQQMDNRESDMIQQLKVDEASNPCNKRKDYVGTYFEQLRRFKVKANKTLKELEEGGLWNRAFMLLQLDGLLKEGKQLLKKADQLMKEGLTRCEVYTRGMRLSVGNLIGNTSKRIQEEALRSIKNRAHTVGIHGNRGAGKTTLMKFLYNDVYDDHENFKAVFWARAPQEQKLDIKSIQNYIADAMHIKFEDEDVVRRSSQLARKLKDMAGHVVIFLDNVKEPFVMYEVGIPVGCNETENFCCTLVFTAASEDVCNKMRCSAKFKMDLLPEHEAQELFLHEAGRSNYCTQRFGRRLEQVVVDVAKQCAQMPLVITLNARSMIGNEDLCEWKNRLNELMGIIENMHGDEAKILEQLKSIYNCLTDSTTRVCFIDSASVLLEGHRLTRQKLIQHWIRHGRISRKCRRGSPNAPAIYDRGHTIINELQRMYLLEIVELDGTEYVSMNKWIRKLAEIVPPEEYSA